MNIELRPFIASDRKEWEVLARGYKAFYGTALADSAYEATWKRLLEQDRSHGLGAHASGRLVGIAHYLFHTGIWSLRTCYLEDLFVEAEHRGRGIAGALIEAVAERARNEGADRLYWLTHETNATARTLYDRVAKRSGFLEYEYPI